MKHGENNVVKIFRGGIVNTFDIKVYRNNVLLIK